MKVQGKEVQGRKCRGGRCREGGRGEEGAEDESTDAEELRVGRTFGERRISFVCIKRNVLSSSSQRNPRKERRGKKKLNKHIHDICIQWFILLALQKHIQQKHH